MNRWRKKMRMATQHPQTSGRNDSSKLKLLFHLGSWDYLPLRKKSKKVKRNAEKKIKC